MRVRPRGRWHYVHDELNPFGQPKLPACATNPALYGSLSAKWPEYWPYRAIKEPPWHIKCPACVRELERDATARSR